MNPPLPEPSSLLARIVCWAVIILSLAGIGLVLWFTLGAHL